MTQLSPELPPTLDGPTRRLAEELREDGIQLSLDADVLALVLEELDHARRAPVFENRPPFYGSFVLSSEEERLDREGLDVIDLSVLDLSGARTYADGRLAFLLRRPGDPPALACFDRQLSFEVDVVRVQEASGAHIVQRTAVLSVPRLYTDGAVIAWNGRQWMQRPTASALAPAVTQAAPALDPSIARDALELAVHWLSPGRVGATLVLLEDDIPWTSFDTATATRAPALSIANRRHFPALLAALRQHDLATVVDADGNVRKIGVGLRYSREADEAIPGNRGMRHRSAQRFSFDHEAATVVVISEDGPVTVFRHGEAVGPTASAAVDDVDAVDEVD